MQGENKNKGGFYPPFSNRRNFCLFAIISVILQNIY